MSKALVIKGAGFAANRVTQITLSNPIPCTGIELSAETLSLTAIGQTGTLTATVTPADTTEDIVWSTSDEDVATVEDGVVTCTGVGSATITASCGTQSATCTVTATHTVDLDEAYHAENGARYSGSMNLPQGKNHISRTSDTTGRLYYSLEPYGLYRAFANTSYAGQYAIPIPKGTKSVSVQLPEGLRASTRFVLANAFEKQTYISGEAGEAILGIHPFDSTSYPVTIDLTSYPEGDSFIMSAQTPSGGDASTIAGHTVLTFS